MSINNITKPLFGSPSTSSPFLQSDEATQLQVKPESDNPSSQLSPSLPVQGSSDPVKPYALRSISNVSWAPPNLSPSASKPICMEFLSHFLTGAFIADLSDVIGKGQRFTQQPGQRYQPDHIVHLPTYDSCFKSKKGSEGFCRLALKTLENERSIRGYPIIGAILSGKGTDHAVTIQKSSNEHEIRIFCPNGNPKAMQGKKEAFNRNFSSLEDAISLEDATHFLFTLYPEENFDMEMFVSRNYGVTERNSRVAHFLKTAHELDRMADMAMLPQPRMQILLSPTDSVPLKLPTGWVHMNAGSLVLFHLLMLEQKSSDSDYAMKLFEDTGVLADHRRARALVRAQADFLLHGYTVALNSCEVALYQGYRINISLLIKKLTLDVSIPELEDLDSYFSHTVSESDRRSKVLEIRAKLIQKWYFL